MNNPGYNGGGSAVGGDPNRAGGGGGGTDLRAYPYGIDDRIMVAGGGGGATGNCIDGTVSGGGGDAGWPNGHSGEECAGFRLATGGTQSSGGQGSPGPTVGQGSSLFLVTGENRGDFFSGGRLVLGGKNSFGAGGWRLLRRRWSFRHRRWGWIQLLQLPHLGSHERHLYGRWPCLDYLHCRSH